MTHLRWTYSFITILLILTSSNTFGQKKNRRSKLGLKYAKKELRRTLKDSNRQNYVNFERVLVKDSITAISVVEPILFGIYGKKNITKQ